MMLDLLAQILDDAVEHRLLTANPDPGQAPAREGAEAGAHVLEPDMVVDLLDIAEN